MSNWNIRLPNARRVAKLTTAPRHDPNTTSIMHHDANSRSHNTRYLIDTHHTPSKTKQHTRGSVMHLERLRESRERTESKGKVPVLLSDFLHWLARYSYHPVTTHQLEHVRHSRYHELLETLTSLINKGLNGTLNPTDYFLFVDKYVISY